MKEYLKIEGLCCGYPGGFRLGDVSFGLSRGMFGGIIGPNGSGKTTLFKALSGELKINGGNALLDGVSLPGMPLRERARRVAVVSQFPEAIDISVEDYVLMGRLPYREPFRFFETSRDKAIARRYMKLTDVYDLRHKSMIQLSGGEQQLAAIAQALTQEPDLLLLDEPTSHLDISHQVQILNLIQKLNHELNLTVLMIIHDLSLAAEYCDHLVMMHQGKVFKQGEPIEVIDYKNIETVYNTLVITQINPVSGRPAVFLVSERMLNQKKQ
jgi:iron complex transport system ATP-binding protein